MSRLSRSLLPLTCAAAFAACADRPPPVGGNRHEDLVALFRDWRAFQPPRVVEGVPDYSAPAMAAQHRELASYQRRLAAIDTTGWTVAQRVDYQVVQAEMNGLDFDQRVLRPWERNPAFYVQVFTGESDQPAREGPVVYGAIELWHYQFPLDSTAAAELDAKLRAMPGLLQQARNNLTGNAHDLWIMGTRAMAGQSADLAALATRVAGDPALVADVQRARGATEELHAWLEAQASSKTGPSGVGVENYDWYLANVQLVPYTWHDEVVLMRRELARAWTFLALEEQRNRHLAPQAPIASAAEYGRRFNAAVSDYMAFLRDHDVLSVRDYMDPALRARLGEFTPPDRREFFDQVNYRDPMIMLTHDYHWFDKARALQEPPESPIRREPLLYNIFNTRTEGFATGMEEMMMQAGMFDSHPRAKELVYVLLAERAARALGDLMMHANRLTLAQAVKQVSSWTPRGWLPEQQRLVWGEQHLYLQQPGYGTSYVIGKIQAEQLIADRARQLGDQFSWRRLMDQFNAVGMIPMSLVQWELTEAGEFAAMSMR